MIGSKFWSNISIWSCKPIVLLSNSLSKLFCLCRRVQCFKFIPVLNSKNWTLRLNWIKCVSSSFTELWEFILSWDGYRRNDRWLLRFLLLLRNKRLHCWLYWLPKVLRLSSFPEQFQVWNFFYDFWVKLIYGFHQRRFLWFFDYFDIIWIR